MGQKPGGSSNVVTQKLSHKYQWVIAYQEESHLKILKLDKCMWKKIASYQDIKLFRALKMIFSTFELSLENSWKPVKVF